MPVYVPTKDDIIGSLETSLRLKDEHIGHLNEQLAGLRVQLADRERLLHLQAEQVQQLRDGNAALRGVLERWRKLCELGLQDVVSSWVAPTVEKLWEETDELVPPSEGGAK